MGAGEHGAVPPGSTPPEHGMGRPPGASLAGGWPQLDLRPLDDPDDPALADYVNLRGPQFRRVWERQRGIFVAEGEKVVARLLAAPGWHTRSVLIAADRLERMLARLPRPEAPVLVASQAVIDRVTGFNLHRGVLAAADRPPPIPWRRLAGRPTGRLLIAEAVNDQENLGSLFRSASALGAIGLLLSPGACDPLYRRTVRVSMGAVFGLPFATVDPWPAGLTELADRGWEIVAMTPAGSAAELEEVATRLRTAPRVAVLVGAEGPGLSLDAVEAAGWRARIPMEGGVDSLNLTVAAAIALHALREPSTFGADRREAPSAAGSRAAGREPDRRGGPRRGKDQGTGRYPAVHEPSEEHHGDLGR